MFINQLLIVLALTLFTHPAFALWKCVNTASGSESFTDTPVYSEGQTCEKVENIRFNKTEKARSQTQAKARRPSDARKDSAAAAARSNEKKKSSSAAMAAQKTRRVVKRGGKCPNAG